MTKVNIYSVKSKRLAEITLPKSFKEPMNEELLAQAVHVYEASEHYGTAKTKTRSEVARTTKKWFKQKGTGHARHGARSAPIFVGGGVAHGPKGFKRKLSLPQKMKKKALAIALALKNSKKQLGFADIAEIKKTNEAARLIVTIRHDFGIKNDARVRLVVSPKNRESKRYFRNLKSVLVTAYTNLNAYKVFNSSLVIFDKEIFERQKK